MQLRLLALVTAASLLAPTAFARLGETQAEILARYGAAEDLNSDDAALPAKRQKFHYKSFTIVVSFEDGKSVCELVFKSEDTKLDSDEINGLLAANSAKGQTWSKDSQGYWRRSDHRAVAHYFAGTMEIYTADWEHKLNRTLDQIRRDKTKGF